MFRKRQEVHLRFRRFFSRLVQPSSSSQLRLIEDMLKRTILEEAEWSSEEREDMERRLGRIRLITLQILTGGNESPGLEVRCRNIETSIVKRGRGQIGRYV